MVKRTQFKPYGISNSLGDPHGYSLAIHPVDNARLVPTGKKIVWHGTRAGVIDSDGRYIRKSGLERSLGFLTSSPDLSNLKSNEVIDEEVIFAGYIFDHYGHFLLESLARAWAYRSSKLRIVWASTSPLRDYQLDILSFLGVDKSRIIIPERDMTFRRVYVPTPGYIVNAWFHFHHAAQIAFSKPISESRKVYLSREGFYSNVVNFKNEKIIENELSRFGWTIIKPHELSTKDQIDLFSSKSTIAGIEGSAFHTAILCGNEQSKHIMIRRSKPNLNFDTIASAIGFSKFGVDGRISDADKGIKEICITNAKEVAIEIMDLAAN
ncbi:glycosyltransferase family 61 protein [Paracoccus sp. NGMCC 1.201697]|uniref:Glycosyltransferase family 61 protein n=1 Tax=Paracoccus broussonetiae subsp. drimophilus TaxID=3373869 RepID=A0ABW7LRE8_9RHOB